MVRDYTFDYFWFGFKNRYSFLKGGCRGNENNFDDKEKCDRICGIMVEDSSTSDLQTKSTALVIHNQLGNLI